MAQCCQLLTHTDMYTNT